MTDARKSASTTRGRPFPRGNPGRPTGSRHKVTLAVEALLDGQAEGLTQKAIDLALDGDTTALRLCIERIAPAPKGRRLSLDLPPITTAGDVSAAFAATTLAMADGNISPDEAATIAGILDAKRRSIETVELEQRLSVLEAERDRE